MQNIPNHLENNDIDNLYYLIDNFHEIYIIYLLIN